MIDPSPYQQRIKKYAESTAKGNQLSRGIGQGRLALVIAILVLIYFYLTRQDLILLGLLIACIVALIVLIRWHQKVSKQLKMDQALLKINQEEAAFLNGNQEPFDPGKTFVDTNHAYSYDLDIFGPDSLYQHLNRTASYPGRSRLAQVLNSPAESATILQRQQSVAELGNRLNFRQELLATARQQPDSKETTDFLRSWSLQNPVISSRVQVLMYVLPVLLVICLIALFTTHHSLLFNLAILLFLANLGLLSSQQKAIKSELLDGDQIDRITHQYALIIRCIENEAFASPLLRDYHQKLVDHGKSASEAIHHLSTLLQRLDSINNGVVMIIYDGLCCYHLHILKSLYQWRQVHGRHVSDWLQVIGEMEMLNSLANFHYNNPKYALPEIVSDPKWEFEQLGHPLISGKERVCNDLTFDHFQYIILTGSNMSGKSTFLRSLGVNMVLASCGAPVCASSAKLKPLPVWVSMRVADSLSDHESYFFAEVRRLKTIMDHLEKEPGLVLLDEILRGTNSDDKRKGTLAIIKRLASMNAIGALATHDLEICNITNSYPDILSNHCFEVEIIDQQLHFDYRLRDGICQNQSATFLMQKMGVIENS